ncbi:hypothetical protein [Aestuariivirga sp.]|uniref:hypothetical protein n=1 Tax=Aestuariivirga sp. TaxID=2650926 RepID=UPI003594106E
MAKRGRKKRSSKADTIIACYGQFWDRELVDWRGRKGVQREHHKLGGKRGQQPVEVADQIGIYVLYDDRYEPVYAGQVGRSKTKNAEVSMGGNTLFSRLKVHATSEIGGCWRFFSWYGLKLINKDGTLRSVSARRVTVKTMIDAMEAAMIASFEPRLNSQSGNLKSSTLIKQVPDPNTRSKLLETRLDRIEGQLKSIALQQADNGEEDDSED